MTAGGATARGMGAATPPFPPAVLRAFGAIARERFGLARMERNPAGLARRLALALRGARLEDEDAAAFVRTLHDDPEGSPRVCAAADAITNRETWFFRDHQQLQQAVTAASMGAADRGDQRLRVLSAGCASGEEPMSVAMLALASSHLLWGGTVEVVGFDVSPAALERARFGRFRAAELRRAEQGPADWEARFFRREGAQLTARTWLSERVRFEHHNLLGDPGQFEAAGFDLVLCRNVLIYFGDRAAARALEALLGWVRPGGWLVLGSAEAGLVPAELGLERTAIAGALRKEGAR